MLRYGAEDVHVMLYGCSYSIKDRGSYVKWDHNSAILPNKHFLSRKFR